MTMAISTQTCAQNRPVPGRVACILLDKLALSCLRFEFLVASQFVSDNVCLFAERTYRLAGNPIAGENNSENQPLSCKHKIQSRTSRQVQVFCYSKCK